MTDQYKQEQILNKFAKYDSFINAKGIRRTKAVEWAMNELKQVKPYLKLNIDEQNLLQKVGWNTFIGISLYSSILPFLDNINSFEIKEISYILKLLINDIIEFTDIGYLISLGVSIESTEQLKYARIDHAGNIFIFPVDAEILLFDLEKKYGYQ